MDKLIKFSILLQLSLYQETKLNEQYGPDKTKFINATGGGAYKYASLVKEKLGTTLKQLDEMHCLIKGLSFLLLFTDNEAFTYHWKENKQTFITREQAIVLNSKIFLFGLVLKTKYFKKK